MIFSDNLRILLQNNLSISALCRDLGLNRTQFHRFLTGEAYPRPDVLRRLCDYFGVDGRILLEPLSGLQPVKPDPAERLLSRAVLAGSSRAVDDFLFPDGIYRLWRRSFSVPGSYESVLMAVRTVGNVKALRGADVYRQPLRPGSGCQARRVPWHGVAVQSFDGLTLYTRAEAEGLNTFSFLEFGAPQSTRWLSGVSVLARRRMPGAERVSPLLAERFEGRTLRDLMKVARGCGLLSEAEMPSAVLQMLRATSLN